MKKATFIISICAVVLVLLVVGFYTMNANVIKNMANQNQAVKVKLETNYGNIVFQLRADQPITSGNFEKLVRAGTYDNTISHRIIDGFMIQAGDPTGTGYGDPKIPMIRDEFNGIQKNNIGTVAMANAGPNTGSSQFFINLVNNNFLDGRHPVFADVVEGMDVVDKIAKVQTNSQDKPLQDVKIIKASVI